MVMDRDFTTASPTLANYSYSEIRSGTGFQNYFLIQSDMETGQVLAYHLTEVIDYSSNIKIQQQGAFDEDFDLSPFTLPQTVHGDVKISIPTAGSSDDSTDLDFELYRVTGGVETQIGSTTRHRFQEAIPNMAYIIMPIVEAQFAVGDILRLRIQKSSTTASTGFGIDPKGRTDATFTITTITKISIPFKLDL
jgi:hypothetical protein